MTGKGAFLTICHLCIPANLPLAADAVMEMYISKGQNDRDPYWADLWPSSVAMAQQLLLRPYLVEARRVCEVSAA